jgi:hypothetical protein
MLRWALALIFVSAFALTAAAGSEAVATNNDHSCSTRANVLSHLATKYSEAPVAVGLAENGGVIEVLTSTEGGTWTIIVTMPDGTSCMVAAGQDWEQLPKIAAKGSGI